MRGAANPHTPYPLPLARRVPARLLAAVGRLDHCRALGGVQVGGHLEGLDVVRQRDLIPAAAPHVAAKVLGTQPGLVRVRVRGERTSCESCRSAAAEGTPAGVRCLTRRAP